MSILDMVLRKFTRVQGLELVDCGALNPISTAHWQIRGNIRPENVEWQVLKVMIMVLQTVVTRILSLRL